VFGLNFESIKLVDREAYDILINELGREKTTLQMIPSENLASKAVLEACGSIMNNKYSEGYPTKRYYQGNKFIDDVEILAIERAKKLFNAEHVNVQPYSGSPANLAVYSALVGKDGIILGMRLDMGGHLTHGHKVNASSQFFNAVQYGVDKETHLIDYDEIRKLAEEHKPKIIVSGATAYPRRIDFKQFHEIAEENDAHSMADVSHIAGLIVGDEHPSPFPFTDVVMTTTHKTLRGPRGAMIMCKEKFAKDIDRAVFPGSQGGPHEHIIAGKAVCFKEAMQPSFKNYAKQIVKNAKKLEEVFSEEGIKMVSGGTDNHLLLLDLTSLGIGKGKDVAVALEEAGIIMNCNTIPYDPSTPFRPSGLRLGTPALTTMGMKENEMQDIGKWISDVIKDYGNKELLKRINNDVKELCKNFEFY
jgi:glycine hydroxymethyltransferase